MVDKETGLVMYGKKIIIESGGITAEIPLDQAKALIAGEAVIVPVNTLLKVRKTCLVKMCNRKMEAYLSDQEAAELHEEISQLLPPKIRARNSNAMINQEGE